MSFQSLADVFNYVQDAPLTSSEVLVLLTIANYADRTGANAYPSLATLGTMTKLSRRKIQYTLRALEHKQVLTTTVQRGRTGRQTYRLQVPTCTLGKGAGRAPLEIVKGAQNVEKGAPCAPDPVPDPDKEQKSPDDARAGKEATPKAMTPPVTLETLLTTLDAPTLTQLDTDARQSLLAEGTAPWFLIRPVVETRMLSLWEARIREPHTPMGGEGRPEEDQAIPPLEAEDAERWTAAGA